MSPTRTAVRVVLSLLVVLVPLGSCTFVASTAEFEDGCTADRKACPGVGGKKDLRREKEHGLRLRRAGLHTLFSK